MRTGLLLSGGMDSIALAWWKRPDVAITIDYGQRAAAGEMDAAAQVCRELGITHCVVTVNCASLGSGDMAGTQANEVAPASDWWPFRNQLLITIAGMRLAGQGIEVLHIGTVRSDGESHADGLPEFIERMDRLMSFQEGHLRIEAPGIGFSTAELIRHVGVPPELMAWSHSCHKANVPCGNCRGCNKYFETYQALGSPYLAAA